MLVSKNQYFIHNYIIFIQLFFLGGTNKSHFVTNALCGETVRSGRLLSLESDYLRVGHSKTGADRMFATNATVLISKDYFNHQ